ncbi:hypothetical protein [Pseudomonas sp. MWU12-2037]|uniref:hypothetical protein n=1 Tax=Pseudomonas sp. MWU12-2037 TaxID=2928690 RepID=UPI00200C07BF|nr:hypothetical protein [Pseudomonas sp. MWU12-2037]
MKIIRVLSYFLSFISASALVLSVHAEESAKPGMPEPPGGAIKALLSKSRDGKTQWSIPCSANGYNGDMQVSARFLPSNGHYTFLVETIAYKISPNNGRNKGNINFRIGKYDSNGTGYLAWYKSPDAMIQDAQWHSLNVSRNTATDWQGLIEIEYIFDDSFHDTKCSKLYKFDSPASGGSTPTDSAQ